MARYTVTVPPTMDQGNFKFNVSDGIFETAAQEALWTYNDSRAHDGQEPLSRMPNGTTYTRRYEYEIRALYNHRYGYECVTTEETRTDAKDQIKCYRDNEPGIQFIIVPVGL